jgi:hypothetical protein
MNSPAGCPPPGTTAPTHEPVRDHAIRRKLLHACYKIQQRDR